MSEGRDSKTEHQELERLRLELERLRAGLVRLRARSDRIQAQNDHLHERLRRELGTQRELAQGLGATQQVGAILGTTLHHAMMLSGADSGAVYLRDEASGIYEMGSHIGVKADFAHARARLAPDHPILRVVAEGHPFYLTLAEHAHLQDEHDRAEGLTSCVHLPIRHGPRLLGVLTLSSHSEPALDPGGAGSLDLVARQMGAALARSQAEAHQRLLARVVESSIVATGVCDLQGRATYVNPALVELWGHSGPEGLLGGSVFDWWAEPPRARQIFAEIMERGSVTSELEARRADGSTFWVLGTASMLRDNAGRPSMVMGSWMDLTELRRGREALRQVRLADAINGLLQRALHAEGERDLGQACVDAALQLTAAQLGLLCVVGEQGVMTTAFAGGPVLPPAAAAGWGRAGLGGWGGRGGRGAPAARQRRPVLTNTPASHPEAVGAPPGHPAVHSLLLVPMLRGGRVEAILGLANKPGGFGEADLLAGEALAPVVLQVLEHQRSERLRLVSEGRVRAQETMLRQSQKLEAIGRLAGGVAHDFNNLLAVVVMFGQSALDLAEPDSDLADDLRTIVETAEQGARLTRQLLAFGRRAVLQPVSLQAGSLVLDMEVMIRRLLGGGVELVVEAEPDAGWVHADPGEMGQVLLNLVVNARDAMPQGGRLTIAVLDPAVLDDPGSHELEPGAYVELRVTDNGCGMVADQLQQIFEPFYTTKEHGKGTGLGLATVYGIVRQSGGAILVESEPGRGSCFRILLPRREGTAGDAQGHEAPSRVLRGSETILLAEDNAEVRRGTCRILKSAGYRVLEAANAGEALLIAEQHVGPIHALLTDVDMPRISGPRLARRLALARPALRVLFFTGHGGDVLADLGEVVDGGVCLLKPFGARELSVALRQLLDGEQA